MEQKQQDMASRSQMCGAPKSAATEAEPSAAFTPGPWVYGRVPVEPGSYQQYEIGLGVWDERTPSLGGRVHGCRGDEYMQVGGICREADARLIAAAPDLLEALKNVRDCLYAAVSANVDIEGFDPAEHVAIKRADAAIVKATGSQA